MKPKGFVEYLNDLANDLEYLGSERYELASTLVAIANNPAVFQAAMRHSGLYGEIVGRVTEWAVSKYETHAGYAVGVTGEMFPSTLQYVECEVYLMLDALAHELRRRSNLLAGH